MYIRCKFDGGKQINRSQSGSWQAHCAGTCLQFNEGAAWGPHTWQQVLLTPLSDTFLTTSMAAVEQNAMTKKRKATDEAKAIRKRARYNSADNSLSSRQGDYNVLH